MAKHFILLISIVFIINQVLAQNTTYQGRTIDGITNQSLPGVTVELKSSRSLLQIKTNLDGKFAAQAESVYTIRFTAIGYEEKSITISALANNKIVDLGLIALQPRSNLLEAVVVQGKKPPLSFKIDRQVYKANQFGNAATGNGLDVLKNLPSVSMNAGGEISFRGSSNFLLLLNGKPTQGDPSVILAQLSSASIENVEIITNPAATYDADGRSGIINIVTKTGVEEGWMLQSNVMYGLPPVNDFDNIRLPRRYGADISAALKKNKWDISAGINYLRNDITGFREGMVYTIREGIKTYFPSTGERSFKKENYGGRFTAFYQLSSTKTISGAFYIGKRYQLRDANLVYHNYREKLQTGQILDPFTYYNSNSQEKQGVFIVGNLDYEHLFTERSKMNISALYEGADLSGNTYNRNLHYPNTEDTLQYTFNPNTNPLHAYRIKADFFQKLGDKNTLQVGYQFRYDNQKGNFLYYTQTLGTDEFVEDPEFTSRVNVQNRIHAGYAQFSGTADKLSYSAGGRLEYSQRTLQFSKGNEHKNLLLTNFFPSTQLRYKFSETIAVKAGYGRRITRTNNYELNPFPEREHSETLEQGDPNLLPTLTGTYEIGWEQTIPKGNFFVTLYHQRIKDPIQRVNKIYNDSILNRIFTNAGRATQTGAEANFSRQVTPWWQTVIGGNIYKYKINGVLFNGTVPIRNSSWVYSVNSTQSFNLPSNWLLQLSINYLSERVTAQGEDSRFLTPNFTVKKTSKDKRWYFQAQWLYIDAGLKKSNRQRISTQGADFYTTTNYIYEPDQIQLSVGFNLLRKNRKITLPVSEMGEKEF